MSEEVKKEKTTATKSTNEEVASAATSILKKLAPFAPSKQLAVMQFVSRLVMTDVAEEAAAELDEVDEADALEYEARQAEVL